VRAPEMAAHRNPVKRRYAVRRYGGDGVTLSEAKGPSHECRLLKTAQSGRQSGSDASRAIRRRRFPSRSAIQS